jgi:hypothetical protein
LVVINSRYFYIYEEDKMRADTIHDFHLIMDRKTKGRLADLNLWRDCRGISGVIVNILKEISPVVKQEHQWGEQRMSRYKAVCSDPDEVREHMHVYLPEELYRELKLLHQDLNFFSIAQMVREFLEWFLGFVAECKGDALTELKKIFSQWAEEEKNSRLTLRGYLRQLFRIIRHLPGKNRLVNIYNKDFSPFWIMRM